MSQDHNQESGELRRLRSELGAREEELDRLQETVAEDARTIEELRGSLGREEQKIDRLQHEAVEAERIERAQRALIQELRAEVGEATELAESVAERLRAADLELVDLRAIRDALAEPVLVQRAAMTIAAEVIPAVPYASGDFFFAGDGPGGTTVMAIGDVVGHGLPSVRRAAFTRTALASVAPFSDDPSQLLRWVNVALVEHVGESAEFVTAACATYNPDSRLLRLASAGHLPALALGTGVELAPERAGPALGLARNIECSASTHRLGAGTGMLLYTDGLIEARGGQTRYGADRVSAMLRARASLSPHGMLEALKSDLRAFAGEEFADDVALLILRAD